ncbi:deoxyribonuclease IV [Stratiformator vulcanicus]|uniref:Probable endonuclease 4 n=1 Tax=Stratiformator vulcanicus TaxID=2527980 RepID=A0A517R677_9PLAN|nr:deoxyribonuclease IV [Stratiformator vulcanicus]QDT39388.1 Endonuclease 4 [Stratiformator vulcanicus]
MPLFGAHLSIAGGYHKAAEAAAALKMDCVQIFTKNNNQWRAKPITEEDVSLFREAVEGAGLSYPCAHTSYLLNPAAPDDELWHKSIDGLIVELERAEQLGLAGLVLHPGSPKDRGEEFGLDRITQCLDRVLAKADSEVPIWLEATAGQGSHLGHRFEQLGELLKRSARPKRLAVCIDTCHIFAAGYPIADETDYEQTIAELDHHVGLSNVAAFHLNDSKKELGSRVDRHEHIGQGKIGREGFRNVVTDSRFDSLPMYLETPKGQREKDDKDWDAVNLGLLRRLKPRAR